MGEAQLGKMEHKKSRPPRTDTKKKTQREDGSTCEDSQAVTDSVPRAIKDQTRNGEIEKRVPTTEIKIPSTTIKFEKLNTYVTHDKLP